MRFCEGGGENLSKESLFLIKGRRSSATWSNCIAEMAQKRRVCVCLCVWEGGEGRPSTADTCRARLQARARLWKRTLAPTSRPCCPFLKGKRCSLGQALTAWLRLQGCKPKNDESGFCEWRESPGFITILLNHKGEYKQIKHMYTRDPDVGFFFCPTMQTGAEEEMRMDGVTLASSLSCLNSANLSRLMRADKKKKSRSAIKLQKKKKRKINHFKAARETPG